MTADIFGPPVATGRGNVGCGLPLPATWSADEPGGHPGPEQRTAPLDGGPPVTVFSDQRGKVFAAREG